MKFSTNEILLSKRKKWTKQNSISGCNASTTPFLLSPKHYLSNYIFLGHFNKVGFHFVGKWLLRGSGGSTERHYSERSSAKRQLVSNTFIKNVELCYCSIVISFFSSLVKQLRSSYIVNLKTRNIFTQNSAYFSFTVFECSLFTILNFDFSNNSQHWPKILIMPLQLF